MAEEELIAAIRSDDASQVRAIIEAGFPVDSIIRVFFQFSIPETSTRGWRRPVTPLDYAVIKQSQRTIEFLLGAGGSPDHPASEWPALFSATLFDRADLIDVLIDAGANPNRKAENGIVPIMLAASLVRSLAWETLRKRGASLLEVDEAGRTVLFYACRNARPPFDQNGTHIVQACLDEGIDPNVTDKNGLTALLVAATSGPWAAELLLQADADPSAVDANGRSFLIHSSRSNFHDSLELALATEPDVDFADKAGWTPLHYAVLRPFDARVEQLIQAGAEVDKRDNRGRTPLMHLARQGNDGGSWSNNLSKDQNINRARLLMAGDSDPSLRDIHGNNVWHHLAKATCLNYYEDFRDYAFWDAFWDARHPIGYKSGYYESTEQDDSVLPSKWVESALSTARTLLEDPDGAYGISDQNVRGDTAIMLIAGEGNFFWEETLFFLELLLSRRADLSAINQYGDTVLTLLCTHFWAEGSQLDHLVLAAEALCSQGVDVNAKNFVGKTALSLAIENRLHPVANILRRYGAEVNVSSISLAERLPTVDLPLELDELYLGDEVIEDDEATLNEVEQPLYTSASLDESFEEVETSGGEDSKARQLHSEAYSMYQDANTEYKGSGGTYSFIKLTSGRRTVQKQVDLYKSYIEYLECGGRQVPRANHPGRSLHNFGMAIDVERGTDEQRLLTALTNNGWIAAIEDEGWHFEAQAAPSFTKVKDYIQREISPVSTQIADAIVNAVLFSCHLKKTDDEFGLLETRYKEADKEIRRSLADIRKRRIDLNAEAKRLNDEATAIGHERTAIAALRRKLNGMVYDRCPNGESYSNCTHENYKQEWNQDRQELANAIRNREDNLKDRKEAWEQGKRDWRQADRALRTDEDKFKEDEREFNKLKRAFEKLRGLRAYWKRQLRKNDTATRRLATKIQSLVDAGV